MRLSAWGFYFKEAFRAIRRNGIMSIASTSTVAIALLVLSLVVVVAVNVQYMTQVLEKQVQVVVYLNTNFDRQWEDLLVEKARAVPHVVRTRFVTKEEGMAELKKQLGTDAQLLNGVDETGNPIPDALYVWVDDPRNIPGVVQGLQHNITSIDSIDYKQDVVQRLTAVSDGIRTLGIGLVLLLAVATLFIISNTIRLTVFARRREVAIMKLVGATNGFIRWPFLLEGALLGLLGSIVAAAVVWLGYTWLVQSITLGLPFVPVLKPGPLLTNLAEWLVAFGLLIGGAGSALSLRRFLQV